MTKNIGLILLLILLAGQLSRFGNWWWAVAPIALFAVVLFPVRPGVAFLTGLLGGALLWWGTAFWINMDNGGLLAGKIGQIFQEKSPNQLLAITTLLGGLLGGLGALTGAFGRTLSPPRDHYQRRRRR